MLRGMIWVLLITIPDIIVVVWVSLVGAPLFLVPTIMAHLVKILKALS